MQLDFNPQFEHAIDLMETTDQHLFITGKAGTGKSTVLEYFCAHTQKAPVILAPTGVAALNVKGQTIHRFFNFDIDVTLDKIRNKESVPRKPDLYKNVKTIIIDEVSMLRADLLDCIDGFLRIYGPKKSKEFGGVQMIFIGDLYQLPPVVGRDEHIIFSTYYETSYFFSAHAMEPVSLEIIELEKIYRQKDEKFISLLNKIRNKSIEDDDIAYLNQRYLPEAPALEKEKKPIHLTSTNNKADMINADRLSELPSQLHTSEAEIVGEFSREYYPTVLELQFKVGAQIMLLNNDSADRWINGSMGTIKAVVHDEKGDEYLEVYLHDTGHTVFVYRFTWEVFKFSVVGKSIISESVGSFKQYPFRLAWAITIHKSQGKTFEYVIIDLERIFAKGQTYVALSRCTSFEGMRLTIPLEKKHVQTDFRIYKFLTSYAYKKSEEAFCFEDKVKMIEQVIAAGTYLDITYLKANDVKSDRIVQPIQVGSQTYQDKDFIGMSARCTLRNDERMFRVDRILHMKETNLT